MTHDRTTAPLTAALEAVERGWPVFPLRPDNKRPAGHAEARCPGTGRCSRGHRTPEQRATTDPDLIRRCWGQRPYGVGIATGPARLVVIDLDIPKESEQVPPEWAQRGVNDGLDVFAVLCEENGQTFPTETYTVRTGRGGLHLYFTAPAGKTLRSSGGTLGWKVDTRAAGGYVVAAGSTVNHRPYVCERPAVPSPLPAWLIRLLTPPPAPAPSSPATIRERVKVPDAYAATALRGEIQKVQSARQGGRNRTLYFAAYALARLVAAGTLPEQAATDELTNAGLSIGLDPRECASAIRSGLTRGANRQEVRAA